MSADELSTRVEDRLTTFMAAMDDLLDPEGTTSAESVLKAYMDLRQAVALRRLSALRRAVNAPSDCARPDSGP